MNDTPQLFIVAAHGRVNVQYVEEWTRIPHFSLAQKCVP